VRCCLAFAGRVCFWGCEFEEGCCCFSCGFLEAGLGGEGAGGEGRGGGREDPIRPLRGHLPRRGGEGTRLGGGECVGDEVAEDGQGLGLEVGVDGGLAGCVDAFDGGDGLLVGLGFGDGEELVEGQIVGLADDRWGEGGVEEGFEERLGELGGRKFRKTPSVSFADTSPVRTGEVVGFGLIFELVC